MSAQIIPFRIERQGDGELRISDTELSGRLGYANVKGFRRLIRDHEKNLNKINQVHSARLDRAQGGGRSSREYWLTEAQALYMISRSDKEIASDIMVEVSISFVEMRKSTPPHPLTKDLLALTILSPEVRVWEKRFEKPFFENLHRVLGVRGTARNNHPNCGHFINRYVYAFLFGQLGLEVIQDANPANDEYQRAFRHHQLLKAEHEPAFRQHISTLNTLLSVANGKQHFDDMFNSTFPKQLTQIGFAFNELQSRVRTAEVA